MEKKVLIAINLCVENMHYHYYRRFHQIPHTNTNTHTDAHLSSPARPFAHLNTINIHVRLYSEREKDSVIEMGESEERRSRTFTHSHSHSHKTICNLPVYHFK